MRIKDAGMLLLLAALWGGSFLFTRVAAPVLGPFLTIALRVSIAGAALLLYARLSGQSPAVRRNWKPFLVMGALNAALPFTLIAAALINLNASFGSILNATTTFSTAVVAAVWLKEPFSRGRVLGIALGVAGVVVLVGWNPSPLTPVTALSILAILLATLSYGIAAVYARTVVKGIAPLDFAIGQQLGASLLVLPVALLGVPAGAAPSAALVLALGGLALLSTALAYLLYYRLIASVGPTGALSVTFLVPAFGILWGVLLLGEPIGLNLLLGLAIILAGMALVMGLDRRRLQRMLSRPARGAPDSVM